MQCTRSAAACRGLTDRKMDSARSDADGPAAHAQYSAAQTLPERSQSGHMPPPSCPAPWTPLSPSTCHLISPQYGHGHRFTAKESTHHHGMSRQFLSAVPMNYGPFPMGTPFGTSPPQHTSFLAAHHQKMVSSVRGSPSSHTARQSSHMVSMPYASPPLSDSSSRVGMQLSPCMTQPRLSPRGSDHATAAAPQPVPSGAHDTMSASAI